HPMVFDPGEDDSTVDAAPEEPAEPQDPAGVSESRAGRSYHEGPSELGDEPDVESRGEPDSQESTPAQLRGDADEFGEQRNDDSDADLESEAEEQDAGFREGTDPGFDLSEDAPRRAPAPGSFPIAAVQEAAREVGAWFRQRPV